jgi:CDP-glucose 4,6-dehydratase
MQTTAQTTAQTTTNSAEYLRGRHVLITGHTGFKGSWLALWLHHLGTRVSGYALPPATTPNNFTASGIGSLLAREIVADIRDLGVLQAAVNQCEPDVIFHLAAQALVRQSYADARLTFEVNVMGAVNVLEAVRKARRPCVVIVVTSDKCYDNPLPSRAHGEGDRLGGQDPYSASKAAVEIVTQAYRRSFFPVEHLARHGVKVASVRAGNAIGGGDWSADRIVPDTVLALSASQPVRLRNPRSVRPWQHVLDPLHGYLTLASRMLASDEPELCSAWNFGPDPANSASVRELVEQFLRAWGGGRWESSGDPTHLHEEQSLLLCNDRARAELDWRPRWDFAESVQRTAQWYKNFYHAPPRSARELCLQDICDYESNAATPSASRAAALQPAGTR